MLELCNTNVVKADVDTLQRPPWFPLTAGHQANSAPYEMSESNSAGPGRLSAPRVTRVICIERETHDAVPDISPSPGPMGFSSTVGSKRNVGLDARQDTRPTR